MTYVIQHLESKQYLTDYHNGKGSLTNTVKDWTKDVDDAMQWTNKPIATLASFDLLSVAQIIKID